MAEDQDLLVEQIQALPFFASHPLDEACKLAGISSNCLCNWMKLPKFKNEFDKLRSERAARVVSEARIKARKNLSILVDLMERDDSPTVQHSDAFEFSNYDYFDWDDDDKIEKLEEKRSKQWLKIYKKIMDAEEKGDSVALAKAQEALRAHKQLDNILKKKARAAGYYWS